MHGQERLDAAIVGAGFAGLALACHLAEHGRLACVVERRPDLRSGGAAILLQPNGLAALDRLGVLEPVLAAGSRIDRYSLRDLQDRELASYDWGELVHPHPFLVAIRRADVATILAQRMAQLGGGAPRTACEFQISSAKATAPVVFATATETAASTSSEAPAWSALTGPDRESGARLASAQGGYPVPIATSSASAGCRPRRRRTRP